MHEVLVNRLGGLSLSRKSVVRLTDRPDMTLDVIVHVKQQQQHEATSNTCGRPTIAFLIIISLLIDCLIKTIKVKKPAIAAMHGPNSLVRFGD